MLLVVSATSLRQQELLKLLVAHAAVHSFVGNGARCTIRGTLARASWSDRRPHQFVYLVPDCFSHRPVSARAITDHLDRFGDGLLYRYVCCFRINRVTGSDSEFSRA